ncbi:hypothetical protein [Hyalangium versicolor]|uniref:hypothetical protein n=1 Tax=Hyalangium versicolor TaxID=2861190 RepID=UPI001CC9E4B4|nr:hypothetical protein [Hyalangium versicolor]
MATYAPLWALVPGGKGVPLAKVGGEPEPAGSLRWPMCRMCGTPMRFLFQLPHVPEKVDLSPYAAVYVFQCENPDTVCYRSMPDEGANAAMPVAPGEPKVEGERPKCIPYNAWSLGFAPTEEDTAALSVDVNEATSEQLQALDRAQEEAPESKVGGVPVWLNGDAMLQCCGEPARFVAQVSAMPFGLDFGDNGRGYLFRCQRQPEHFKFLSQGA